MRIGGTGSGELAQRNGRDCHRHTHRRRSLADFHSPALLRYFRCAMENWKPIQNWPHYEVSDLGRVRRATQGRTKTAPAGLLMCPWRVTHTGYLQIKLCQKGSAKKFSVHVLVCEAFHGPRPSPRHVVRHLDGSRSNCRAANLAWGTFQENEKDKEAHGTKQAGDNHYMTIITARERQKIIEEWKASPPSKGGIMRAYQAVSDRYGVSGDHIRHIIAGRH